MPSVQTMDADVDYLRILRFKTSTLIEDPTEQELFLKVIDDFIKNEDVTALIEGVKKSINGQSGRLQFYDDVRRLVPPRLQMEYNLLAPYTSSRVRTVRLLRGLGSVTGSAIFGFSIRGGREHGTGFFVSEVGEEARAAGLRVGDQILRINGYSVEHAIHQEVLKLIQDSNHLNLKVRSVGMIPVKENDNGPETASEDDSNSAQSYLGILNSEPVLPIKTKPQLIRKQTPPALTLTEREALKKITGQQENDESPLHFQPQLETIPADKESPPSVDTDRRSDPLIWVPVNTEDDNGKPQSPSITTTTDSLDQPVLIHSIDRVDSQQELKHLTIAARSKLDCSSICKGPDWHPGIFIQSTKEGGLAREAGLRPGDQIIECNGVNFEDISFSDAVNLLKKDKNLNLVIRKGSGNDLFLGESSGYNSSASSVNGDGSSSGHSPNGGCQIWNDDAKRLSIVREEVSDMTGNNKIQSSEGRVKLNKNKDWDEIEIEWEMADKQQSLMKNEMNGQIVSFPSHYDVNEERPAANEKDSIGEVTVKTQEVVAIVHRSEVDEVDGTTWNKVETVSTETQSNLPESQPVIENHTAISQTTSNSSAISKTTTVSLSRALSLEIQKRAQKFGLVDDDSSDESSKKNQDKEDVSGFKKDLLKEIGEDKRMQHSMLMEEFKKVHSKMFANSLTFEEQVTEASRVEEYTEQRQVENESSVRSHRNSLQNVEETRGGVTNETKIESNSLEVETKNEAENMRPPPPPPPPLPCSSPNTMFANGWAQREKEVPPMSQPSTIKKQISYTRTSSSESLTPKSPKSPFFSNDNNIQIIANGKATEEIPKRSQQALKGHVSVTISEYPSSNASRHEPAKMPIFEKNRPIWKKYVETSENKANPAAQKDWKLAASQVQSELQQTLSRSKLKEHTETPAEDKKQNGKTLLSGNTAVSRYLSQVYGLEKEEASQPRSTPLHNTDKILNALANKVTIRVPNSVSQAANKPGGNH